MASMLSKLAAKFDSLRLICLCTSMYKLTRNMLKKYMYHFTYIKKFRRVYQNICTISPMSKRSDVFTKTFAQITLEEFFILKVTIVNLSERHRSLPDGLKTSKTA